MHRREGAREDAGVTRRILTLWVIYDNPLDYPGSTKKGPDERGLDCIVAVGSNLKSAI